MNTERIAARLPLYMDALREGTVLRALIETFGSALGDAEEQAGHIMRSRWFFHADLADLERMGELFGIPLLPGEKKRPYRQRFYLTVRELLGGAGTVNSIMKIVEATIGSTPGIEENPAVPAEMQPKEVRSADPWTLFNNSVGEDRPVVILRALARVRDPALTNMTVDETVRYRGILRKGSLLRIMPGGRAMLAGIDVSSRIEYMIGDEIRERSDTPRMNRGESQWKYTDATGSFGYGRMGGAVFAAGDEKQMSLGMKWTRYKPATFEVRIPLYSRAGRGSKSVGYEKHLRQEVRHLVDYVKSAGVMANINFHDTFAERNPVRDLGMHPTIGMIHTERNGQTDALEMEVTLTFSECQPCGDRFYSCGAFDVTEFDSTSGWR